MPEDDKKNVASFSLPQINTPEMSNRLDDEITQIELKIKKHKGKEELLKNLENQKEIITQQKEEISHFPDFKEIMEKVETIFNKLMELGEKQSELEKEYIELLEK